MDSAEQAIAFGHDFTGSADATECWGTRPGFQPFGAGGTLTSTPVTWTPGGHALGQTQSGPLLWINGENMVSGPQAFAPSDRVQCYRYYQRVAKPFGSSGNGPSCQGFCSSPGMCSSRNKVFQVNFAQCTSVQMQEGANGGDCTTDGSHQKFQVSVPVAPSFPNGTNFDLGSSVRYNPECDDKPCRFEMCIDSTNLATGADIVIRARVCSLETNTCATSAPASLGTCGPATLPDFWGGDVYHNTHVGGSELAFFMSARWTTDTDQWIGPAVEVEGP